MRNTTLQEPGPLLSRLLAAQRIEEQAVAYPLLARVADAVAERARQLDGSLVWPIGAAAERVAGAVTVRTGGEVEVGAWNDDVADRRVLIVVVAGVSGMALQAVAAQLRRRGAAEVHGCGVAVDGASTISELDSYAQLEVDSSRRAPVRLLGDAA